MNASIIKPMMMEIKVKDELIRRVKEENAQNMKDLKMLKSILKIPVLCQEF